MLAHYFFSINIEVTNTADLRTKCYVKNKQKSVKNETFCMLQIKQEKLWSFKSQRIIFDTQKT